MDRECECFRQERIKRKQGQESHETHMRGNQQAAQGED